jgi:thiol-disulfide isomerase/thioredoxin
MAKYFTLFLLLMAFRLAAQLPSGSVAPDFTVTDVNGNTHRLYDYLNDDKVVILDFSATWCGPCWSYHNSGALRDFYNTYGPPGLNKAMVIFMEADTRTNTACLFGPTGCNNSTMGNWVAGKPYPIVDLPNSTVTGAYRIGYYPTVYGIYPNRILTEVRAIPAAALGAFADAAPAPATEDYEVRIVSYEGPVQACGGDLEISVRVQNYGKNSLSGIDFEIYDENGNLLKEHTWTGTLNKYDFRTISFGGMEILESTRLIIKAKVDGQQVFGNSEIEVNVEPSPEIIAFRNVRIEVTTDNNASETSWEMRDSKGALLFTNDANLENNRTYSRLLVTREGECYRFSIFDSRGNGLQGNGGYRLIDNGGNGDVIAEGKNFTFSSSHGFGATRTVSTGQEIVGVNEMQLYPNPVRQVLYAQVQLDREMSLSALVIDERGAIVRQVSEQKLTAGDNLIPVQVDHLIPGNYFFVLQHDGAIITKPFVKL